MGVIVIAVGLVEIAVVIIGQFTLGIHLSSEKGIE